MAIQDLTAPEIDAVAGGFFFFCLPKISFKPVYCAPKPVHCAPKPVCPPKPDCTPKPDCGPSVPPAPVEPPYIVN